MFSELFDGPKNNYTYAKRTICEVHREIYDIIILEISQHNKPLALKLIRLLEEAYNMGLKMNAKLIQHKDGNDDWAEPNVNKDEIDKQRQKRINLIKSQQ